MVNSEEGINNEEIINPGDYGPPGDYIVQVKFKKGVQARLKSDESLESKSGPLTGVQKTLEKYSAKLERAFDESEENLVRKAEESKSAGVALPDLSKYYVARVNNKEQAEKLAKELSKDESVEDASSMPPPKPAAANLATVSFVNMQGYLGPAPGGVDAQFAWTISGGKGTGIKMIDIEGAWNFSHEDLLQNQNGLAGGTLNPAAGWRNHGTAVIGEIGGDENPFGITGIAPQCNQRGYSIFGSGNAFHLAMKNAADLLSAGDIILIELHAPGPDASGSGQDGYIAMEWWDINFDAIKYATAKGIIVVEAAGNGSRDLDAAVFQNKFNRSVRDSGAILVGAGAPPSGNHGPDRSRLGFSNWGGIVDAQGWGREVVTTGYGDLQGGSENQWYTEQFSGTSSASPIVVGVVGCLQGMRKAKGEASLTFTQIRNLLHTTGSPQQDAPGRPKTQRIGNRPNIREMHSRLWPEGTGCDKYKSVAEKQYELYKQTHKKAHLCKAYYYFALYYNCLYKKAHKKQYLCLFYKYKALYYKCQYEITSKAVYLTFYKLYWKRFTKCSSTPSIPVAEMPPEDELTEEIEEGVPEAMEMPPEDELTEEIEEGVPEAMEMPPEDELTEEIEEGVPEAMEMPPEDELTEEIEEGVPEAMEALMLETPALVPPCHKFRQAAAKYLKLYKTSHIKKYLCYYYLYLSRYYCCLYNLTKKPIYLTRCKYYRKLYRVCVG